MSPLLRLVALFGGHEGAGELLMAPATRALLLLHGGALSARDRQRICQVNSSPGTARAFSRMVRDVIDWKGQRRHVLHSIREVAELPAIAVFWGEEDRVIPLSHGQALCATLENCTLCRLPGAGHFLHWQAPRALAHAVLNYLDAPVVQRSRIRARALTCARRAPA